MGSNLGESEKIMRGALRALETSPLWTTTGKSSFYRTVPWGKKDQPDFLNAECTRAFLYEKNYILSFYRENIRI